MTDSSNVKIAMQVFKVYEEPGKYDTTKKQKQKQNKVPIVDPLQNGDL